jgi:methenyltetrahydromethanopterin cyclohydrolase
LQEVASQGVLVLEAPSLPTEAAVMQAGLECELSPKNLIFCVARTASLPGTIQIVARSIETTLHKLDEIGFDLRLVVSALGTAPLPPIGKSDMQSIGWTNDAIIFGSQVTLWVDCEDSAVLSVGARCPSESSADFGRPFIEIFEDYDRDFYRIDKLLFSPAKITIHNVRTGKSWVFGKLHYNLLNKSIGLDL